MPGQAVTYRFALTDAHGASGSRDATFTLPLPKDPDSHEHNGTSNVIGRPIRLKTSQQQRETQSGNKECKACHQHSGVTIDKACSTALAFKSYPALPERKPAEQGKERRQKARGESLGSGISCGRLHES